MKHLWFIILMLLLSFRTVAQSKSSFNYIQYSTNDGLPSPEVYKSIQDDKGYMWFATDRGVARFNGRNFERFSLEDGLKDVTIFDLFKDQDGRIWFFSFNTDIYYYEHEKINRHCLSDSLKKYRSFITDFHVSDNRISIIANNHGLIQSHLDCSEIVVHSIRDDESSYIEILRGSHPVFTVAYNEMPTIKGVRIKQLADTSIVRFDCLNQYVKPYSKIYTHLINDVYYCLIQKQVFIYEPGKACQLLTPGNQLNNAILLDQQYLWLGTTKGLYKYDLDQLEKAPQVFLEDYSITSINKDNQSGYWFTTHNDGVLYVPAIYNERFTPKNGLYDDRIDAVTSSGDHFYFGGYDGNLYALNAQKKMLRHLHKTNEHILELVGWPDGKIGFGRAKYKEYDPLKGDITEAFKYFRPSDAVPSKNQIISLSSVICIIDRETRQKDSLFDVNGMGFRHMAYTQNGILLASRFGLFKLQEDSIYPMNGIYSTLGSRISDLITINDSITIVSTLGAGIVVLKENSVFTHITTTDGLADNLCNRVFFDQSHLWVATNSGISKFDLDFCFVRNFNLSDGLVSKFVYDVEVNNDWILATTDKGVSLFKEAFLPPDRQDIPVYLNELRINGANRTMEAKTVFQHDENNLQIRFDAVSFKYHSSLQFRYRLLGFTEWVNTHNNELEYNSLPPGNYHLQIQAGDGFGWWAPGTASYDFSIVPPIWSRPWFVALVVLILIASAVMTIKLRVDYIKRQQVILNEISFYQNQALGSQINPHFIFNSLNSVQAYAVKNETKHLMTFVSRFAKLIRSIFEVTSHNMVSLETELNVLERYLEFEKLRFKENLEYRFHIDQGIEPAACQIPPLLIQPLAENAIKHGILKKTNADTGRLDISISKKAEHLKIIISDNGGQFSDAAKDDFLKQNSQRPSGIKIVRKRLELMQKWTGQKTSFELYNEKGQTSVILTIPYIKTNPKDDTHYFSR